MRPRIFCSRPLGGALHPREGASHPLKGRSRPRGAGAIPNGDGISPFGDAQPPLVGASHPRGDATIPLGDSVGPIEGASQPRRFVLQPRGGGNAVGNLRSPLRRHQAKPQWAIPPLSRALTRNERTQAREERGGGANGWGDAAFCSRAPGDNSVACFSSPVHSGRRSGLSGGPTIRPRASRWHLAAATLLLTMAVGAAAIATQDTTQDATQAGQPYRVGDNVFRRKSSPRGPRSIPSSPAEPGCRAP